MAWQDWFSSPLGFQIIRAFASSQNRDLSKREHYCLSLWHVTAITCACLVWGVGLGFLLEGPQAWANTSIQHEEKGTIVAAGFGYQIGDISTITVKVYDAATGEVLSEDVYELSVMEEHRAAPDTSWGRLFAGGVGLGSADLSNFVLRVYDARTGKFQWEGQLNLTPHEESGTGQTISFVAPRHAPATMIDTNEPAIRQPIFSLRAMEISTGRVVWEDQFSADGFGTTKFQQVAARLIGLDETSAVVTHAFDFRIRMFDFTAQEVLWEDQVSQQGSEEDTRGAVDE